MPNIRMSRINSEIQKAVATIIDSLENPDIKGNLVCVQKVNTSPDLLMCTIAVSCLTGNKQKIVNSLNASKNYIRKNLGHKLILKTLPELTFVLDTVDDYAAKMDKLFKEIEESDK